ncbi:MAG: LarC family nickel insertion protein, partial [Candidatus Acidiferrales bacterium]
ATALATSYAGMPRMTLRAIGYGAGSADNPEKANVLRLLIGDNAAAEQGEESGAAGLGEWDAPIAAIETNLDDMSPQIFGYVVDRALAAGALDVYSMPIQMKKNRPATLLTILARPEDVDRLIDMVFRETTTLGVRVHESRRKVLAREIATLATPLGNVRMKISRMNGTILNAAPEYEDCRRIAAERGIPLKQVIAAAAFEFEKQRETRK